MDAQPKIVVVDDTVVTANGTVDFRNEQIDILTKPVPKDPSPFVLRTPIRLTGGFNKPSVKPQLGPLLARGAAALALGALNPLLAFVPFIETGPGKDSDCHQLLRQVKSEGVKETKAPAK